MGCAASTLRRDPEPPSDKDDAAPQGPKVFVLEVDATRSKAETWHEAAAAREDRIAALQSPLATEGEEHPQQLGEPSRSQQVPAPAPAAAAASSSSSKAATTRRRRLSLPGEPTAGIASDQAAAQGPAASATDSSAGTAAVAPASSASSSASGPAAPPAALSAQPALPVALPLPERRVRFDDSPVKTHKLPEEEAEEEAEAAATPHVQPHLEPIRTAAAEPAASLSVVQPPVQQPAPQRAGSPSKAIFDAALAARNGLPTLAAAAAAAAASSPRKSAAALAVPMSDLIHSVASLSRAGKEATHRKTNQDSCCAYSQYCRPTQALLAALDGHGPQGHHVSGFLKERLPQALAESLGEGAAAGGGADLLGGAAAATAGAGGLASSNPANGSFSSTARSSTSQQVQRRGSPSKSRRSSTSGSGGSGGSDSADGPSTAAALAATFLRLDADVRREMGANANYSGSTAAVCMLQGRRLTTAWVGDSKAVLARQDPRGLRAIPLTRDHKPNHPDEKARILGAGGRVQRLADARGQPVGPSRVWLADSWVPGLAMSRAIGDIVAHTVGVSSEPETSAVELCPQDKWLVLATDGVWEFIDPQAAIDIVGGCKDAEEACRTLVDCAWAKWLQEEDGVVDDITVVAVKLNPV